MIKLGLTSAQIWQLTFAQYVACIRIYTQEREILDYQFGWTRAIVAETVRDHKKRSAPFKPEDFMCWPTFVRAREMSIDEQLAFVTNVLHPYFSEFNEQQAA